MLRLILAYLIFLLSINCINSELKCNFREYLDTTPIYTCELAVNTESGHIPGKTDNDVQSIKFDGFNTNKIFNIKQLFCKKYKNLEIVKLFSAGIADLNPNLFNECVNLKFLSLASNKIRQIPENLVFQNSELTTLSLEQNNLTNLPGNVFANLKDLSDLNLSKNQIETLPQNIFSSLLNLRVLKLNSNKILNVNPNWFRSFRKLEDLDLSNNLISNLGEKIFQMLTNLLSLQLSQNKIEDLKPNVFHNLYKLQELNLDFNKISKPSAEAFWYLTNLKKLSFGANGIEDLPEFIFGHLRKLEELKLWQNRLSTIHSDSFGTHNRILSIDIEDNEIDAVDPSLIDNLGDLRLYMDGNVCYQGDLEDKMEMLQELKECFENYEPRENMGETTKIHSTTTTTRPVTTYLYPPTTSLTYEATTAQLVTTTTSRAWRTQRPTTTILRPATSKPPTARTTTTEEEVDELFGPQTHPTVPTTTESITTTTSLWNLLEPENIPTCGRSKLKQGAQNAGAQVNHGAYPWTAALIRKDGQLFCGGILVSKNLVVTAAHCIEGKKRQYVFTNRDFFIMLGAHNVKKSFEKGRTTVDVKTIHVHQDWNPYIDQYDADIAIIELETNIKFNRFIQPICIPEAGSIPATKTNGIVVGFGKTEFKDVQDVARLVPTPIHDNRKCHSSHDAYQLLLSHRGFCGGYANGTGVCTGDSGSGLIVIHDGIYYLRGIVSASINGPLNGCNLKAYSMYTDILEFTGWIKIGKDDKTLIQYLIDRLRKCEDQNGIKKRAKISTQLERSNTDSWRIKYPDK